MKKEREGGFAIVTAISFMVVVGVLVSTALLLGLANRTRSADTVNTTRAQLAAESGIDYAMQYVYTNPLVNGFGAEQRTLYSYANVLDKTDISKSTSPSKKLLDSSIPANAKNELLFESTVGDDSFSTRVKRTDRITETPPKIVLDFVSSGYTKRPDGTQLAKRIINQTVYLSPNTAPFDFAMLSRNVNCSFCHTKIESMVSAFSGNAANTKRVRVGTIYELDIRFNDTGFDSTDTLIGGTLYSGNKFIKSGTTTDLTKADVDAAANKDFLTYTLDPSAPTGPDPTSLIQSSTLVAPNVQTCSNPDECKPRNNFYAQYLKGKNIDGPLPNSFPLPIVDKDGDRVIDDDEWKDEINYFYKAAGNAYGELSGSKILFRPMTWTQNPFPGNIDTNTTEDFNIVPTGILGPALPFNLQGDPEGIKGSLVIRGDFKINGSIFVDGDVIISGRVSGKGRIVTRGNIYVAGDLVYSCDTTGVPRDCTASEYKNPEALPSVLGLLAGGNLLIGDYLTQGGQGRASLISATSSLMSWSAFNFTMAQVANFNKFEKLFVDDTIKNPSARGRFYALNYSDIATKTNILYYNGSGENANSSSNTTAIPSTLLNGASGTSATSKGVIYWLNPTANWVLPSFVKQEWINNIEVSVPPRRLVKFPIKLNQDWADCAVLAAGTCEYIPLRVDSTLYSANASFALVRGSTNNDASGAYSESSTRRGARSLTDGRMILNGSLISSDMGVLAAGSGGKKQKFTKGEREAGLTVNYDPRAKNYLNRPGSGALQYPVRSFYSLKKDE